VQHNHRIGTEIMMYYPNNRHLTTTESQEIENVLGLGGNKKLINEEIQKKFWKTNNTLRHSKYTNLSKKKSAKWLWRCPDSIGQDG